ncbi:putative DNA binding domain-containing protein [Desulfobotulus sp. H1]|uniref:DNA binding domain-containing protein n=1 Tax=Desulfobotulus pelophilus TaxID=2823377 RepID=A0ABT3N761_9BACT|nr:ATP-binding protein [Desulfobotulus pelophilus]MCW7753285.1 putative DNA binding domain-containing protein [Desulfobotulus pelophilus]
MSTVIPPRETLTVEFKSDHKRLSDTDLIEAIVCLANAEGGDLWLGVEDDGTPTGLHPEHFSLDGLAGLVAARTSPSLTVAVEAIEIKGIRVARIRVPKSPQETATRSGVYLRRRLKHDGTPECVPMLPHDRISRASTFGLLDVSARPVAGATLADLDPLERERLRQNVETFGGDKVLLELEDADLDGVLGLTHRQGDGTRTPTLTGLLLIGRESALRQLVPTHELAFQVMAQEAVRLNEFRRFPLLKALDWLETNFRPYNPEEEVRIGMFRVPVPKVDMDAFREAVANALIHRDYHRLGAVHVRLEDDALVVSNPGGLVEGVTLANILTTEPRPRNPALADALKRIGIVERSGRGVDTIYRGMLRFGRALPDYSRTDAHSVILRMPTGAADLDFLKLIVDEENRLNSRMPVDSLIALSALRQMKRLTIEELAGQIQRDAASAKRTLEALIERGMVEGHGTTRGRSYTLSASLYRNAGDKVAYTRQAAFSALQNEQMVLNYTRQHGGIKRAEVANLCHLSEDQASRLLNKLHKDGKLEKHGQKRWTFYTVLGQ